MPYGERRFHIPIISLLKRMKRYCIPMDDPHPVSGAEVNFFKFETGRGTGYLLHLYIQQVICWFSVPVIAIFTKFDGLEIKCYSDLRDEGRTMAEARNEEAQSARAIFNTHYLPRIMESEFPPKAYVSLKGMAILYVEVPSHSV